MFILKAFSTLIDSYVFYFSSFTIIGISVMITIGRCYQVLFKDTFRKLWYVLVEIMVQVVRVIQYALIISLGTRSPISTFTSNELWDKIFLSLYKMTFPEILWDFFGFIIVFGVYNLVLNMIFSKPTIESIMKKRGISTFSVTSLQLTILFGYKNLLLIPVSFIYILIILKIM